jgi:hypothetical protein
MFAPCECESCNKLVEMLDRIIAENAVLREGLRWVIDNPRTHPANMVKVANETFAEATGNSTGGGMRRVRALADLRRERRRSEPRFVGRATQPTSRRPS